MTYFIQWVDGYGWMVRAARHATKGTGILITGFSGNIPLSHVLAWCGSVPVTILPTC